jgi:acyl phosphate:glycerol-3-phosphate acyltransferase
MHLILWLTGAYLIGAVPAGYIVVRMAKGIDIREHGSGNPGATNVFRVIGPFAGILTYVIDFLKGYLPVYLALRFAPGDPESIAAAAGLCAIAGHIWTVFLRFRGGKGVATASGVFLALLPLPTLFAIGTFAAVLLITRYVSLGSIIAALMLPAASLIRKEPAALTLFAAGAALLIIARHRSNIGKLIAGTEHRFGAKTERKPS